MAYDSNGEWKVEDDSVAGRLPGLLDSGSPLMEKAKGDAMRTANRRGLQNSSIAAGEGTKAALSVALPIASQDASQTAQKNLAAQGFGYNTKLQGQQIEGQKEIVGIQESGADRRHASELQSREAIAARAEDAAMSRLKQQGVQDQEIQKMRDAAEKERQGVQLTSEEKRLADQLKTQVEISNNQIESSNRGQIINAVGNANATYTNYVNGINSNENIPPAERNRLIADAGARRDAEVDFVEQVYDVDLDWAQSQPMPETTDTTVPANNAASEFRE